MNCSNIGDEICFIDGEKIFLRPLKDEDAYGSYPSWLNNPIVCRGNSHGVFPYTSHDALDFISASRTNKNALILAIIDKQTSKHIGNVSLQAINFINRSAELAILLGERDSWGKGIGTEACRLMMMHGFKSLNLHRIYLGTASSNHGMQKIADRLGMSREGCRKEAFFKNGVYEDIIEYGIIRH